MKNTFKAIYMISSTGKNPSIIDILFIALVALESAFEATDY